MYGPFRIEGFAIASTDGMLADHTGLMPSLLKLEADQQFFRAALDRADVLIHGRLSHEGQPTSHLKRRLIMTRKFLGLAPVEGDERARYWNPAGASLEAACAAVGRQKGLLAVLGGTDVYQHFLGIGYDAFLLCRAVTVSLPGGVPVFPAGRQGVSPETVLAGAGLHVAVARALDEEVSLAIWIPGGAPAPDY
jgi:dihydrofolate reductase